MNKSAITTSRRSPVPVLMPKICVWKNEREAQTFDFFRCRTAAGSKALLGSTFWDRLLLERTHHEEHIKHIVIALGALHRSYETGDASERAYALSHYNKAIQQTREAIAKARFGGSNANNIVIAVILFHCLENATGNFQGAQTHLKAGMRLLHEHEDATIESTLVDAMHRLDFHAATMSDASAPYETSVTAATVAFKIETFETIERALSFLVRLAKWSWMSCFNPIEDPDYRAFENQRESCKTEMRKWKAYFDIMKLKSPKQSETIDLLEIYYTLTWLFLTCYSMGVETAWDVGMTSWEHILTLSDRIISFRTSKDQATTLPGLSLEMGLIFPLFMTALKCRDPHLRRKAITLLQSQHWQESVWESTGTARVLEAVMQQEELGLGLVSGAEDILELNRVMMVQPHVSYETRTLYLTMYIRSLDPDAEWATVERLISI